MTRIRNTPQVPAEKISSRACLNSSRANDETVLSEVCVADKGVLDCVEVHEREACIVRETTGLVPVNLEGPCCR